MSFPPGAPMHIPGLPVPPMLPPYAVPPMVSGAMIPMTVGMMPGPMMTPVAMAIPGGIPLAHPQKMMKKPPPQNTYKKYEPTNNMQQLDTPKGPPVTVFVGNITDRAPDGLIKQILQRCGFVLNWKRVQGANGKLQAFGFCEYADPESALRAIRLLHDYQIGEKKLVVKADAKTKEKLDEYKASKLNASKPKAEENGEKAKEGGGSKEDENDDELDELSKQKDDVVRNSLIHILNIHAEDLRKAEEKEILDAAIVTVPESDGYENSPRSRSYYDRRKNELDEMDLEEDKKNLIHREIDKFRDTYKRAEEERDKEPAPRDVPASKDRHHRSRRDYDSPDGRSRDREERRGRDERSSRRRRSRDRKRDSPRESPSVATRNHRDRSRERDRPASRDRDRAEWNREREREREAVDEKPRDKDHDKDDDEEAYERKKQERKLREKEAIYQDRLRNWTAREKRKAKEYEKEKQKADDQRKDETKEARRLKEFLEDYEDEKDDPKYFKGSALVRRMKEREREIEEDMLDRQREREELDELRRKLLEEGHPDPDAEVQRILLAQTQIMEQPLPPSPPSEPEDRPRHWRRRMRRRGARGGAPPRQAWQRRVAVAPPR